METEEAIEPDEPVESSESIGAEEPIEPPENLLTDDSDENFDKIDDSVFKNAGEDSFGGAGNELPDDFFDNAVNDFFDETPGKETDLKLEDYKKSSAKDRTDLSFDFDNLPHPDELLKDDLNFKIDFDDIPPFHLETKTDSAELNFSDDDFNFDDEPFQSSSKPAQSALFSDFDDSNDFHEETRYEETKKPRAGIPVIISLLCAIICVIVFLLVLFVIPSRINIRLGGDEEEQAQLPKTAAVLEEQQPIPPVDQIIFTDKPIMIVPIPSPASRQQPVQEPTPPAPEPPPVQQQAAEQPAPPPQPPVQTELTPQPIRYQIKWGDTLWDIAWAYYRNPWQYTYIARYNGIKNPNKINAGAIILIPPR
jgi:hypothetical protein